MVLYQVCRSPGRFQEIGWCREKGWGQASEYLGSGPPVGFEANDVKHCHLLCVPRVHCEVWTPTWDRREGEQVAGGSW